MNTGVKLLCIFADLVAPVAVGYALRRRTRLSPRFFDRVMVFNLVALVTTLSALSFWKISLKPEFIWLPILGVVMQIVPGVVSLFRVKGRYDCPLDQGSYILSMMLSNRGLAGVVTLYILLGPKKGEDAYACSRLVMFLAPFVTYLFCFPLAASFSEKGRGAVRGRASWLRIMLSWRQIPLLGVAAGVVLNQTGWPRPEFLTPVFTAFVHVAAWMFLVPVGYSVDFSAIRRCSHDWVGLCAIKFVVAPLVIYALARLLGIEGVALTTVVVLACAPTAINAVIVARLCRLNLHVATGAFILTMVVYILVVAPLILLFLGRG